jgi:hypothetical protein
MRHRILVAVLALGTIGGFAAGFASLHAQHRGCCAAHHEPTASGSDPAPPR